MKTNRSFLRRISEILFTFLIVSIFSFVLMRLSPVDPATAYARRSMMNPTKTQIEEVRVKMGLDKPLMIQYVNWMGDAFHLDFGESLVNGESALKELGQGVPITLKVVLLAAVIEAIGIVIFGCFLYYFQGKWEGFLLSILTLAAISIPGFYIASIYLDIFAVKLNIISVAQNSGFMKYFHPALCLSLAPMAFYARLLKDGLEREAHEDYVFYLRCRGISEKRILLRHTLPHGVISLIPSFLQNIGLTLAGAAIIERVFSLPGLGYLIIDSVLNRDSPMIHLAVLFLAMMLVLLNIVSDWIQELLQKKNLAKREETI
ncbi:ABC transporter permease [Vallitalea sediminicola]